MSGASDEWPLVELGKHIDLLTGHPFKSKEYTEELKDVPLLRGDNVAQGYFRWDSAKRWNADRYSDYPKFHLREGDVILAMDRPWISAGLKYGWITKRDLPALLVQRVARMRGCHGLITDYLRYLIGSRSFTDHVLSITTGVNVPHISGRDIKTFKFKLPPRPTQQRIAAILSAYDDLIENNTRRIAILEEMARRLYEEWFVHFRFPGNEDAEFEGELPDGWREITLSEIASVNPESIKPESAPDRVNYIDIASVSPGRINAVRELAFVEAPGRARRIVRDGDVVWSCVRPNRRSHALVLEPAEDTVASTGFAVLRATEVPFSFLLLSVTTDAFVDYLTNHATGAAYPAVKQADFQNAKLIQPARSVLDAFDRNVAPMLRISHKLARKNANLRAQRDLLLPKLVSGEIDVSDAEGALEAAE